MPEPDIDVDHAAVAEGLRKALHASGLNQATFARAVGTSASRFSTYLTGRTVPSAVFYLTAGRIGDADASAAPWVPAAPPGGRGNAT